MWHPRDIECFYIEEKYLFPYEIEIETNKAKEEPSIFDIFSFGQEKSL